MIIRKPVVIGIVTTMVAMLSPALAQTRPTTTAAIAIANLDHALAQAVEPAQRVALLLARSRFLSDHDALDEAVRLAGSLPIGRDHLLLRARTYAAAHRFAQAQSDLDAALQSGADARQVALQRASILVATGHADDAVRLLGRHAGRLPGYAVHSAFAAAHAELGRYAEADRHYRLALGELRTTSPFPYAWTHFARGLMWSEQAGDARRGEAEYALALAYLPAFASALVHKAELEFARGDVAAAIRRITPLAGAGHEPEALSLLGEILRNGGDRIGGDRAVAAAALRYEALLHRQPLAFADHAVEFYRGPGNDAAAAWHWARRNLANRATPRAFALAIDAAAANARDVCDLVREMRTLPGERALSKTARAGRERRTMPNAAAHCP